MSRRIIAPAVAALVVLLVVLIVMPAVSPFAADDISGDIDGDGIVDYSDAQLVFDYISGTGTLTYSQLKKSDINGDGGVTIADAVQLFHFASGLLSSLPYEERGGGTLTIVQYPDKSVYNEGDKLDLTGLVLAVRYTNGEQIEVTGYTVSGFEATPGTKIIILSYSSAKTAFTVTVMPKTVTSLTVVNPPAKTVYNHGEELDTDGLLVAARYSDYSMEYVEDYDIYGFTGESGVNTITVFYKRLRAFFDVTVLPGDPDTSSEEPSSEEPSSEEPSSEEPSSEESGGSGDRVPDTSVGNKERRAIIDVSTENARVRYLPSFEGEVIGYLTNGTNIAILGDIYNGEWYSVMGMDKNGILIEGYVHYSCVSMTVTEE